MFIAKSTIDSLNRTLKVYDRELYAKENRDGILCVLRKKKRFIHVGDFNGVALFDLVDSPDFVLALTDNWKTNGTPREWGALVVIERLRQTDVWHDPDLIDKIDRENAKIDEMRSKDRISNTEAFLLDNKRGLQKAWNDINTSSLSKKEDHKRKRDLNRRLKDGNL